MKAPFFLQQTVVLFPETPQTAGFLYTVTNVAS